MTQRLRIAVADDEPDMRDYFARILPRLGHEVVCVAENGRQLVEYCRATHPDLVVTDIRMPEMNGIDAAGAIHAQQSIPVILVSAFHDAQPSPRAAPDQVLAYLVKPIKQEDLRKAIATTMQRFQQLLAAQPADGTDPARGNDQVEAREPARDENSSS